MSRFCAPLVLLAAVVVAGCSNSASKSPGTVTAPTGSTMTSGAANGPIDLLTSDTPMSTPSAGLDKPIIGVVKDLKGTCPTVSFVLGDVTVYVTGQTRFESGTCNDLEVGKRAGAIGTKHDGGGIDAARVKIAPVLPPQPTPVAGLIGGLTGTCPAVSFTLGDAAVRVNAATDFDGGTCEDLKNGIRAGAYGPKGADGVIVATHVKIPPPLVRVVGLVSDLDGDCPALRFVLHDKDANDLVKVRTAARTRFEGGTCSDIKNGLHVGAIGVKNAEGVLEALGVKIAMPR